MEKCSCYQEEQVPYTWVWSLDGKPKDVAYTTICRCNGTKEREECSCGGDRTKCNFYEDVREKGRQMNATFIPGSTVWVVERDEDDIALYGGEYIVVADVGNALIVDFGDEAFLTNEIIDHLIEFTKKHHSCINLRVFPKEDCYVTREYAEQAYNAEVGEDE